MSVRTTAADVQGILGTNYHLRTSPDLTPYIASASSIVDRIAAKATVDSTVLELVERWLSAYFYCKMDPTYASKSTQGASGSFVSSSSLDGEGDRYKRAAIELDPTGLLNAMLNRKSAGAFLARLDDPYRNGSDS